MQHESFLTMRKTKNIFTKFTAILLASIFLSGLMVSSPSYAIDKSAWLKQLGKRIGSKTIYPKSAIRKGIEGRAKVKITIDRQGTIVAFDIIEQTGEPILDKVIEKSIGRISPLPAPPAELTDAELIFNLPLVWRLQ